VRRLAAIEELAGIDVLCADKTGTLTQNKLTLGEPVSLSEADAAAIILAGALASRAEDQDPIDLAVIGGLPDPHLLGSYKVIHFSPFDPVHKRTEAVVQGPDGDTFKVSKGAPQVILDFVQDQERVQPALESAINQFAAKGYRSLGVARADLPSGRHAEREGLRFWRRAGCGQEQPTRLQSSGCKSRRVSCP
jgi:H+-transporting ATPase